MDNLSKLNLVKRHLEVIKSRSAKISGFNIHLLSKYSLDTLLEKEQNRNVSQTKVQSTLVHAA